MPHRDSEPTRRIEMIATVAEKEYLGGGYTVVHFAERPRLDGVRRKMSVTLANREAFRLPRGMRVNIRV